MAQYCGTQDVRNLFKNSDQSLSDTDITPLIIDASGWIEAHTQRILAMGTYTESAPLQFDRWMRLVIRCQQWPITSVTAISYKLLGDNSYNSLDPTQVDIYTPPERFIYFTGSLGSPALAPAGYVTSRLSRSAPGSVMFTYQAGFTSPYPQDLVMATALLTQELIGMDSNPLGARTIQVSAEGAQQTVSFSDDSANVRKAKQILDRSYTRRI